MKVRPDPHRFWNWCFAFWFGRFCWAGPPEIGVLFDVVNLSDHPCACSTEQVSQIPPSTINAHWWSLKSSAPKMTPISESPRSPTKITNRPLNHFQKRWLEHFSLRTLNTINANFQRTASNHFSPEIALIFLLGKKKTNEKAKDCPKIDWCQAIFTSHAHNSMNKEWQGNGTSLNDMIKQRMAIGMKLFKFGNCFFWTSFFFLFPPSLLFSSSVSPPMQPQAPSFSCFSFSRRKNTKNTMAGAAQPGSWRQKITKKPEKENEEFQKKHQKFS